MDSEDQELFKITQDDFTESNKGEEEWLLGVFNSEDNQANSDETNTYAETLNLKNEDGSINITFDTKEVPKADLFVCTLCERVFMDDQKLKGHMSRVHKVRGELEEILHSETIHQSEDTHQVEETLEENWIPDVQRLAKRGSGGKVFKCDQCPYTVTRCDSMTKHVLRVHNKGLVKPQYMCEVCGKTFVDRAYLRNHGLSHIREPQYFCEICGRRFHRQPSLKRHIESHSEEKHFSCDLCDYQTNRKHLMLKHSDNHRIGKAYSCKYCQDKFFTQLSLRKHCYSNHPSRYACSFCKIGFSSRERMWSHMRKTHFAYEVKYLKTEDSTDQDEVKVEYIEVKLEQKTC